jgi:hypothetical protein
LRRDKIYEDLKFSNEYSVDDWKALIKLNLGKYFTSGTALEKNKDLLKTEIIHYIRLSEKPEYLRLFEWIFDFYKECFNTNKELTVKIFAEWPIPDLSDTQ